MVLNNLYTTFVSFYWTDITVTSVHLVHQT